MGQGVALASNPYDRITNKKNIAFGSKLLTTTYLMMNYKKPNVIGPFAVQSGLLLIHTSNGNFKGPNTSVNTLAFKIGLNYDLHEMQDEVEHATDEVFFPKDLKINLVFRSGFSQMSAEGSPQFPFYTFSVYADKRINFFSAFHLGVEASFSQALKEEIYYRSVAFPEIPTDPNADYRRVGEFLGYELFISKLSLFHNWGITCIIL